VELRAGEVRVEDLQRVAEETAEATAEAGTVVVPEEEEEKAEEVYTTSR
jgi:hypothetical protein